MPPSIGAVANARPAFGLDRVRAARPAGQLLKGWFKDTLPSAPIDRLAILRLDGDYYESTMDPLLALYDKLSVGGYVIIDDYGEESWTYCRKAIQDFRTARGIEDRLVQVDNKCWFWRRT